MIESIGIKNYKSIVDLQFDVGRVNVFIGENGCGKSNILEAIALAAAAEANKLDNEFLASRGIRMTSPLAMRCGFNNDKDAPIDIIFRFKDATKNYHYELRNDNQPYSKWSFLKKKSSKELMELFILLSALKIQRLDEKTNSEEELGLNPIVVEGQKTGLLEVDTEYIDNVVLPSNLRGRSNEIVQSFVENVFAFSDDRKLLENMVIYSPEETALRNRNCFRSLCCYRVLSGW